MYKSALINKIRNQIIDMKQRLNRGENRGRDMIEEGIKRKYALIDYLSKLDTIKVSAKKLEKEFKTSLR